MIDDAGINGMEACNAKAEATTSFDTATSQALVLKFLEDGVKTGEDLVLACKEAGQVPHDDRAFGAVFAGLSKQRLIKKTGFGPRKRGRGADGAVFWALNESEVSQ